MCAADPLLKTIGCHCGLPVLSALVRLSLFFYHSFMENICIFGASSDSIAPEYFKAARQLAVLVAGRKMGLVFGGGAVGLMGELARTMHEHGGRVTGVIPERLNIDGVRYEMCDEFIVTRDMRERKKKMDELSDAFIALPGGFGTLEEISEMITGRQLGFHNKPLVFLNTNNFYTHLIEFFEEMYGSRFAHPKNRDLYFISSEPTECLEYLDGYIPQKIPAKYKRK